MSEASSTFGANAAGYAEARPGYPDELFAWLASLCERRDAAWDCATGNGQAAVGLARHFTTVIATDASPDQIAHASPAANIRYAVQPAEATDLAPASVDLITVAQALHWFDFTRFWDEVRRVGRENAVFAAFGYSWSEIDPLVDRELTEPFTKIIAPYWSAKNRMLWDGYRDQDTGFPFVHIAAPAFDVAVEWPIARITAYLATWSSYRLALADPIAGKAATEVLQRAARVIPADKVFHVRIPLTLVVGRITRG